MTRASVHFLSLMACVMVLASASAARAQDPLDRYLGRPLAGVELTVEGKPETSASLLALIDSEIKANDRLSVEAWRRVTRKFDQVPRFDGVNVKLDERPEGLVLIFDAIPKHPVDSLHVMASDTTGLAPGDIERRIRDEFNGIPALARTADVEDAVKRIMRDEGFRTADAQATVVQHHDPDRSTLQIDVNAGPRTVVANAVIEGNSPLDKTRTLARLGLTAGSPFRESALQTTLAEIRAELRAKQYYSAIAQNQEPEYSPDGTSVSLVVTIDAGPLVEIVVNGELPGRLDDYIPVKREASVDRDLLEDSTAKIETKWRSQGYWHAKASYTDEHPSLDRQVITFTIDKGRRYRIVRVDLPKNDPLIEPADFDLQKALKPNALFDLAAVINALSVVKGTFQARGYHLVTLQPVYEEVPGANELEGGVIIHPHVVEGPKAIVTDIQFDLGPQPGVTEAILREQMLSKKGEPYGVANLVTDRRALPAFYESRGYLERQVTITPETNDAGTETILHVYAREGPRILVSEILVVGNEKVSVDTIMHEVTLKVGEAYNEARRMESQRALYNLRIFRSVRVSVDAWLPGETSARVVIAVEETTTKAYEFGGGVEAGTYPHELPDGGIEDRTIFSPRASIGFARTNLGGRDRTFNAFARVSLKPKTTDENGIGSPDYRVIAAYRERYAFHLKSDLLISATAEQGLRTTYNFIKRSASAEFLRPLADHLNVSSRYTLEWSRRFDDVLDPAEQLQIDRLYPQVRISMFSGGIAWDRRDDPLVTTRGGMLAFNSDLALKAFGSEVGFLRTFSEATWFHALIGPKKLIFAARGQLGLARGFDPNTQTDGNPNIPPNPNLDPYRDLPASQRFFSGGSATNRAFQLDRLGAPDVLTEDGLSTGGNGLVLFNFELRQHVTRDVTAVGFVDVGNVYRRVSTIDLSELRTGVGFGVRYNSPIGPLRFDIGYKTKQLVFTGGPERRWEFHLSIGEVF